MDSPIEWVMSRDQTTFYPDEFRIPWKLRNFFENKGQRKRRDKARHIARKRNKPQPVKEHRECAIGAKC